ncbi:energy-coupling factor ABC transporter ATP-binding protein [Mycoplasmatota bacterium]|nr:energy-coupling factor ABC transporter ATP-binding protein [Mycoplasmatota bacterium]
MAVLEVKDLTFKYNSTKEKVLDNVNFKINEGEFVVLCGESGCGKTTLLKLFKKQLAPYGEKSGEVLYNGTDISALDERISVTDIGFVMQNPDNQIVTDKVWHELAFGLENMGESISVIRRKVAEISGFFGISDWYRKKTSELSGGQKQLLILASIMVMQPKVIILDEPTSQLDPIAASEFIATLKKINNELGITILLVEHRLEEVFPIASKAILMDKARVLLIDSPREVGKKLKNINGHKMNLGMPSSIRIFNQFDIDDECPLTVREGKDFLNKHFNTEVKSLKIDKLNYENREIALEIAEGYFRYERDLPDVLSGLNLKVYKNEMICILGGNGAGKTTTLKILNGLKRLYRGKLRIWGKKIKEYNKNSLYRNNIASLPQNPQTLFVKSTVYEDLLEVTKIMEYDKKESKEMIADITEKLEIEHLYNRHPYDLSGGEQQKAAFAKILLMKPKIILLDEPTKGIDAYSKKVLADILAQLKQEGITIVMVTHDIEFAAEHADRCAMFFDGQIVSVETPVDFFSKNSYYTTAASRISRQLYSNTITCDMVIRLCRENGEIYG